jgi:V/A-type H+-transporting ATPase subunit E
MEIQLQELIDQIKKDGVEAAEAKAEAVLKAANEEAEKIVSDAKAKADKILLDAKNENDRMVKSGEDAIRQAGRNLLISFRESVTKELEAIIGRNVSEVYSSEALTKLIIKAVEGWAGKPGAEDISVILSGDDLKQLEDALLKSLKEKMLEGRKDLAKIKKKQEYARQLKDYRFFKCPTCQQKVRVPKGKGKIKIHCPRCHNDFIKKS